MTDCSRTLPKRFVSLMLRPAKVCVRISADFGNMPAITMQQIEQEIILLDRENAFLLFAAFCGDVEQTAHALNISPATILKVAEDDGWLTKLRSIIELKKSKRPGDVERALNRAMNFVQAHRMRMVCERMIKKLTNLSDEQIEDYLMTGHLKDGTAVNKLSTRALADLASAIEKCQALSYLALNDTAQERIKRDEHADPHTSGGELHSQIAKAMAEAGASTSPRAQLLDAQLIVAQEAQSKQLIQQTRSNDEH